MLVSAKIDRKRKTLTITLPLQKAAPSRSTGKTLVVASSHGCQTTEALHSRRPIVVTANAFIYAAVPAEEKKNKSRRRSKPVQVDAMAVGSTAGDRGLSADEQ